MNDNMEDANISANKPPKLSEAEYLLLREGCKIFKGCKDTKGYGLKRIEGKLYKAHRWIWEVIYGAIPKGKIICHRCDRPACVNVDHLFLGSHKDNAEDRDRKGRASCNVGMNNGFSRLSDEIVLFIKKSKGSFKQKDLAKKFGISQATVSDIQIGKTWKHI